MITHDQLCREIMPLFTDGTICEETSYGAKVRTDCLYPSFEQVHVFVSKYGDGFRVTDAGMATSNSWLHGRDDLNKILTREAGRFSASVRDGAIEIEVPSAEWLRSAILAIANASASAATVATERAALATEQALGERVFDTLSKLFTKAEVRRQFEYRGSSGKTWRADFFIPTDQTALFVNTVSPHHISISSKYVAFADLRDEESSLTLRKYAVFDRELESDDVSLISQVADLVPVTSLELALRRGGRFALAH